MPTPDPTKRRRFPHILKPDVPVWQRFLAAYQHRYTHIDYDVRVGRGRHPGDEFQPATIDLAIQLSMRRIDAVGHSPTRLDIIEVTTDAGLTALGQCLAYPILYRQTYAPTIEIRPLLVAARFQPDIQQVFESLQIPAILV